MKKKGIILLITIFFITSITALYIKNLGDSDRLIKNSQNIYHMNYIIKIVEDVTGVITSLNKTHDLYDGTNLEDNLAKLPSPLPLEYGNIRVDISLESFTSQCNINDMYDDNDTINATCKDTLALYGVNFDNFYNSTNNIFINDLNKSIENNKQKDYIIDAFFKNYQYLEVDSNTIKENIHYLGDGNNSKALKCDYIINLSDEKIATVNIIYELSKQKTEVLDLEINFE